MALTDILFNPIGYVNFEFNRGNTGSVIDFVIQGKNRFDVYTIQAGGESITFFIS